MHTRRDVHTAGRIWLASPGLTIWRPLHSHACLRAPPPHTASLLLRPDSALFASLPFQALDPRPRESSRWQRAGVEPLLTLPGTTLFPPQHLSAGPAGTVGRPLAQLETKASHGKFQIVARLATLWPWRTAPGTSHAANSTTGSSWPLRHARRPGEWRPNSCIATIS
jgi:hypothetical protein